MIRFYTISTTDFHPISYRNIYLYSEYGKIKNFLVSNNQQELLNVLAIPHKNKNNIEWSADNHNKIRKLDKYDINQQNNILLKYDKFLNSYNNFINDLRSSKNKDNRNWGELLFTLIQGTANELFFDGDNIFITWGWRLLDQNSKKLIPFYSPQDTILEDNNLKQENNKNESEQLQINEEYDEVLIEEEEKFSLLDKLYLFIKRNWWIVPLLSFLILIALLFKL